MYISEASEEEYRKIGIDILSRKINKEYDEKKYIKPKLRELSNMEIEIIHQSGNLTFEEMLNEWENLGICILDNDLYNCSRYRKFCDCHDCLIDYINNNIDVDNSIKKVLVKK